MTEPPLAPSTTQVSGLRYTLSFLTRGLIIQFEKYLGLGLFLLLRFLLWLPHYILDTGQKLVANLSVHIVPY